MIAAIVFALTFVLTDAAWRYVFGRNASSFIGIGRWCDALAQRRTQRIMDRAERRAVWAEVEGADNAHRPPVLESGQADGSSHVCGTCGLLLPGMTVAQTRAAVGLPPLPAPRRTYADDVEEWKIENARRATTGERPLPLPMPMPSAGSVVRY